MHLGIDEDRNLIYEGAGFYGCPIVPTPIVTPASIAPLTDNPAEYVSSGTLSECKYIFREDSYDPVTRIRRGRFYNYIGTSNWHIASSQTLLHEHIEIHGNAPRSKYFQTFSRTSIWSQYLRKGEVWPLVVLGSKDRFTLWRILSIETNISGEEIVVLRGRHSFGSLPDLDKSKIPADRRDKVLECLFKLQEDIFRASPASVIDRARDVAASILRAHLGDDPTLKADADLGSLVKKISESHNYTNVVHAGGIVRILHSRSKPSVQEKIPDIRQVHEQDAEFAVQCIGSILCDLGWAEWR